MSAILELKEKPQSCGGCQLRGYNEELDYDDYEGYAGAICHGEKSLYMDVSDYLNTNIRHPDCPLKITEDNLRWKLIEDYGDDIQVLACEKCNEEITFESSIVSRNYCPKCGTKLLPPEEEI